MTRVVAGVDVGNATTEVVLASVATGEPIAWDRTMTRGPKGSPSSVRGAAALVRRLARTAAADVVLAAVAPLRPVRTSTAVLPEPPPDTGRYAVLAAGVPSPGGEGVGVGRPVALSDVPAAGDPVVVLVREGYRSAAPRLASLCAAGAPIVGVVLAADEARLVANRLPIRLPIVDGVDVGALATASCVAVEVVAPGRPLRRLTDPLFLASAFGGAAAAENDVLRRVARRLADVSSAVVAVGGPVSAQTELPNGLIWTRGAAPPPDGSEPGAALSFREAAQRLANASPGAFAGAAAGAFVGPGAFAGPGALAGPGVFARYSVDGAEPVEVDDLAVVDVGALASSLLLRTSAGGYVLAGLLPSGGAVPADELLASALGVPVVTAPSEAAAALTGALTTPGAPSDAVVVDLGGGTVDVVGPVVGPARAGARVLAGGGDLLTAAVALGLDVTRGAAEWAKRGPAVRVETPQLATQEDGDKTFLSAPQPAATVGRLAVPGPAGLLPVSSRLGPAEWRTFRLALKQAVLGTAVRRGLYSGVPGLGGTGTVLVVGGPAGDDEVLRVVDAVLPDGVGLGRGNVAGVLGHRYAVAWGLALLATDHFSGSPGPE